MMVTRCQFTGGGGAPNDSLETSIEGAVTALTVVDETAALVVRIEYGAWEIRGLDINAPHIDKATPFLLVSDSIAGSWQKPGRMLSII